MSQLVIDIVRCYAKYYDGSTTGTLQEGRKITHGKEVIYLVPEDLGEYKGYDLFVSRYSEEQFNEKYSTEPRLDRRNL